MADYFTHFSCLLDVGTPDKAARALALFQSLRAADQDADDPGVAGFDIARQDAPVLCGDAQVGTVTSGTHSPTLKKALAMALVERDLPEGDLFVEIRGKKIECHQVKFPFLSARTKGDPRAARD